MPRIPRVSGAELIKRLEHLGYVGVRTIGSHVRLRHLHRPPTTVPLHDVIGPGLLRKILRDTGLRNDDRRTQHATAAKDNEPTVEAASSTGVKE